MFVLALGALAVAAAIEPRAYARASEEDPGDLRALLAQKPPSGQRVLSRPPSDLPLGHWAYPLLERLVARRVLEIDLTTRPVSRAAVADALRSLPDPFEAKDPFPALTERERWAIERLRSEFLGGRIDTPAASLRDGGSVVALGILVGTTIRHVEGSVVGGTAAAADSVSGGDDEPVSAEADLSYELWGGIGNTIGFYSDATVRLEEQEGPRATRLSKRIRSWRGATVMIDRAYVKYERPHAALALGRRGPAWGRSSRGRLLISGAAPTFDEIDAALSVGPLGFHAFHAMLEYNETGAEETLEPSDHVFLAGHRLTFTGRLGSIGLNEVVVYSSGIPDPAYLNPLLPYYVSQHNERANDNVLWSTDFTWRPAMGLELYGEFLVDDLQYDRNTGHPDKYAVTIGEAYYSHAVGIDYRVVLEYSNARKWTYTHGRVEHRYEHDGRPIGFELGPDADRAVCEVVVHPSPAWSVSLAYERARKGEGTLTEAFVEGEESEPAFPSGNVLTTSRVALVVGWDDLEGLSYGFGAAYEGRSKEDGGSLEDEDGWEVWIGAEFRI